MNLINMFPSLTSNNKPDRRLRSAEFLSQCKVGRSTLFIFTANLAHGVLRQRGLVVRLARCVAPLIFSVFHIVIVITQKQVVRSHTRRVVAAVKNPQTSRNLSICNLVRNTVRRCRFSVFDKLSVTTIPSSGCPDPTTRLTFLNVGPEPITPLRAIPSPEAFLRTIITVSLLPISSGWLEWPLTVFTAYDFFSQCGFSLHENSLRSGSFGCANTHASRCYFNTEAL